MALTGDEGARVRDLIDAGRPAAALSEALEVWRATGSPVVADVVEWLDGLARSQFSAPKPAPDQSFHQLWLKTAANNPDVVTIGWLGRTVRRRLRDRSGHPGECMRARLTALTALGPDPRHTEGLVKALVRADYATPLTAVYQAIESMRDVRAVDHLRRLHETPPAVNTWVRDQLVRGVPVLTERLAAVSLEAPPDIETWRRLGPTSSGPSEEEIQTRRELLGLVRSDPSDLDRRRVYADFLLQLQDPHGTFITLQLEAEGRRQRAEPIPKKVHKQLSVLEHRHRREWLGEALMTCLCNVVFEGGFLARASLEAEQRVESRVWARALTDPGLCTLHALERGQGVNHRYADFVLSPHVRNVREVHVHAQSPVVDRLVAPDAPLRRIETLVYHTRIPRRTFGPIIDHPSFVHLRCVGLTRNNRDDNLMLIAASRPWRERLQEVRLVGSGESAADLVEAAELLWDNVPDEIPTLSAGFRGRAPLLRMVRADGGVEVTLDLTGPPDEATAASLLPYLPAAMTALIIRAPQPELIDASQLPKACRLEGNVNID